MLAIFRKEISGFFSSLTGYIVIIVFLLVNSLFMWVFPGELNIIDSGYAGLDTLFFLSPWVFLFLVPAVTMRMICGGKAAWDNRTFIFETCYREGDNLGEIPSLGGTCSAFTSSLPCILFFSLFSWRNSRQP